MATRARTRLFTALLAQLFFISCRLWSIEAAVYSSGLEHPPYTANPADALPTFAIIGTAKGGTTDLYEQLAHVTLVDDPERPEPPVLRGPHKEISFLGFAETEPAVVASKLREYMVLMGHPCANNTGNSSTSDSSDQELKSCIADAGTKFTTIDATPTYSFLPTAAMQLATLSPSTKIIVMLRDPVQRAEILFRHYTIDQGSWINKSLDDLTDDFFSFINSNEAFSQALHRISNSTDTKQLAEGWLELVRAGLLDRQEIQLFAGGLYRYALSAWRQYFLQPGRFMVIDSHEYYRDRSAVMDQVIRFLYGRAPTVAERTLASQENFWRKTAPALSKAGNRWMLSDAQRTKLQSFYRRHVVKDLGPMLVDMGRQGGWIVGFQGSPWTQNPSFKMTLRRRLQVQ